MVNMYKGHCNHCGKYYEGAGKKYCSFNCFATYRKLHGDYRGKSALTRVDIHGEKLNLREIAERFNIPYHTVRSRYARGKRTAEELTKPSRKYDREDSREREDRL